MEKFAVEVREKESGKIIAYDMIGAKYEECVKWNDFLNTHENRKSNVVLVELRRGSRSMKRVIGVLA